MGLLGNPRAAGSWFRTFFPVTGGQLAGGEQHGNILGNFILLRSKGAGATTYFDDDAVRTYGDDFFNGKEVVAVKCSSIVSGERNFVSDTAMSNGRLTFTSAWSAAVADGDLFGLLLPLASGGGEWNYFSVTATMTSATWNTVAAHEIAAVTGLCDLKIMPVATTALTTGGGAALMSLGDSGDTDGIVAATDFDLINASDIWTSHVAADIREAGQTGDMKAEWTSNGLDIGYTVAAAALTGGILVFHVWWKPVVPGASVAAGAGGTFA